MADAITLHCGDCLDVLKTLADNSIDSCVTDPPYGLRFMAKAWDATGIAFRLEVWREVLRVLKPGGHLLAFGGTRTYHRMVCAIEDAGFEVRDCIQWLYGSGFPKSSTSSLKPACEMIVVARKPLSEHTVAANVLRWGTGALNIAACRVEAGDKTPARVGQYGGSTIGPNGHSGIRNGSADSLGRWPANCIHDGSDEVLAAFPEAPGQQRSTGPEFDRKAEIYGKFAGVSAHEPRGDSGSAARFYYSAKADSFDRAGSKHPTVKPVDLIQYLCRLITPPGGIVLDPFAGTGTTGEAAFREGFRAVLIEREVEYQEDIRRRIRLVTAGPVERLHETIRAKQKDKPIDLGPLFAGLNMV